MEMYIKNMKEQSHVYTSKWLSRDSMDRDLPTQHV